MKVICISHDDYGWPPSVEAREPQIGEECEVVWHEDCADGFPEYGLAGYGDWIFDARNFAPLNGPCETEILSERLDVELREFVLETQKV